MDCPFCGGHITRASFSTSSGCREISLCCRIPLEFIDEYDVLSALPESLQQAAIDGRKAEYEVMDKQDCENAQQFRESQDRWYKTHAHLFKETKGDPHAYPGS